MATVTEQVEELKAEIEVVQAEVKEIEQIVTDAKARHNALMVQILDKQAVIKYLEDKGE